MSGPKVSVIVLSYNSSATIRQALDSVLAQRCGFGFEVIVGDDGSTDGTQDIIKEYCTAWPGIVRPLLSSENRGVQANYFDCLDAAAGEMIADCAGDDFWMDAERLQRLVEALDSAPDASMSFSDWSCLDNNTGTTTYVKPYFCRCVKPGELVRTLLSVTGRAVVHLSAAVYRKSALLPYYRDSREDLFRNKLFGCEDFQVLVALSMAGSGIYVAGSTLMYRVGHESAITSDANIAKAARFAMSTTRLVKELARRYNLYDDKDVGLRIAGNYHFALSYSIVSQDASLVEDVMSEWRDLPVKILKTRVMRAVALLPGGVRAIRIAKSLVRMARNK